MSNSHITPKDSDAKDGSHHVAGMPTIAELRRRVLVKQLEKDKKRKKGKEEPTKNTTETRSNSEVNAVLKMD